MFIIGSIHKGERASYYIFTAIHLQKYTFYIYIIVLTVIHNLYLVIMTTLQIISIIAIFINNWIPNTLYSSPEYIDTFYN